MVRTSRVALLTGLSALALTAAPAFAQTPAETQIADEAEADVAPPAGEEIVITGTRRTDRTVADSPVPIDVIGADAIANSGQVETNKILNDLVPSFNFPQPSIADGTDALRPATLRGLSPDQTLVLVNGKRRHVSALLNINGTIGRGSAAVDLNTIPGLAIGRIEVLRDGASSQYGSDAIAGVINIQLKTTSHGGRATATYGQYRTTLNDVADVTGLQTNGTGQPFLDPTDTRVLAANSSGERKAHDGEFWTVGANIGVPMGDGGYFNVTAEYRDRNATNRAGFDLRPNYNRPTAAFDPRELSFNRLEFLYGDPKTEDINTFVNAMTPLGGDWEFYFFGSYGHRDGLSAANYRQQNAAANRDFSAITPGTSPNAGNFVPLTTDGFLPYIDTALVDYSGTAGLRTVLAGWKTDLSLGYGHNQFDYTVRNSLNTSFGPASQRVFDAGGLRYGQVVANLDFAREFEAGFAKPLSVALGAEYRNENFKIRPGDLQSYATGPLFRPSFTTTAANCATQSGVFNAGTGICSFPGRAAPAGAQGFPGIPAGSATDRSRHSYAAYVELDTDPFENFTLTLAGRYEHFSDFGSTLNGKVAARFEPVEGFALRGSVSNGFRAPSLHQQYFTTTSTNFINGLPVDISTLAVDAPVARALGSRDLKPEKSLNISVGATANPVRGLTLTVDAYQIKIDDRIVLTENLGAAGSGTAAVNLAVKALLDANGFQSVGAARFFINGLDTRTRGIDAVATYRMDLQSMGKWSLTAAYNYNKTRIDARLNNLGPLATIPGIVLFGRVEGIRFTDGQPRDKIVFSADGDFGDFGFTARTTRYGKVVAPGATAPIATPLSLTDLGPDDILLGAKWLTDLELRYGGIKGLELAVGADNVFDVYPDRSPFGARPASIGGQYPINQYYLPYSGFSPFGFNGRYVFARASLAF
ncbi:MAG: iron complex outerrane recepter protein [Sphingomonadales bacterium]|jgi:iron complex outermembrane receptor protein|nr:iron complex outerrane recepter protein [Sphingomonadales bacterium]